ncbi:hypothetical protein EC973_006929 [Apophysomyces ossiformis]|uniref:Uncharacterized protein n=1 Tax=Apophysomyces ossiformis TaxID=679940 RepID=A0A8H7ELM4_9FUNG|nr:hypothetical protein EC973_006929 [Apophysomyces ossiformis]
MSDKIPSCNKEDVEFTIDDDIGLRLPSFFSKTPASRWHLNDYAEEWRNIKARNTNANTIYENYRIDLEKIQKWNAKPRTIGSYVDDLSRHFRIKSNRTTPSGNPVSPASSQMTTNQYIIKSSTIENFTQNNFAQHPSSCSINETQACAETIPQKRKLVEDDLETKKHSKASVSMLEVEETDSPLERYRFLIIEQTLFGHGLDKHPLVPDNLYEQLKITNLPKLPKSRILRDYLRAIVYSSKYGTPEAATEIFAIPTTNEDYDAKVLQFFQRVLYQFSENIHDATMPPNLEHSETTYCHHVLWPLLRIAVKFMDTPEKIKMNFKVGETQLMASPSSNDHNRYYADAIGYLEAAGIEVLLMEASGAFNHTNLSKHVYDHIKGAFGSCTMLTAMLKKYEYADAKLLEDLSVVFLHASGKDKCLRAWVMRPVLGGKHLSFERVLKCEIDPNPSEVNATLNTLKFFWKLKILLEQSVAALAALKESHEQYLIYNDEDETRTSLRDLLRPSPMKPKKNDCVGIAELDPSSSL